MLEKLFDKPSHRVTYQSTKMLKKVKGGHGSGEEDGEDTTYIRYPVVRCGVRRVLHV